MLKYFDFLTEVNEMGGQVTSTLDQQIKFKIMLKLSILLARKKELSHDEFVNYHKTNHAQLFASIPVVKEYVRKYVQYHSLPENPPGLPAPAYDGITEIWLDNMEALGKVFTDEKYLEIIRPDEEKFIDIHGCSFLISTENEVI